MVSNQGPRRGKTGKRFEEVGRGYSHNLKQIFKQNIIGDWPYALSVEAREEGKNGLLMTQDAKTEED